MSNTRKLLVTAIVAAGIAFSALVAGAAHAAGCTPGPGKDLSGCDFSGQDLSTANLLSANLRATNLSGTSLSSAVLSRVQSGNIVGQPSSLPAGWALINGYLVGPGANLSGATLSSLSLPNQNLTGATLNGANLDSADLSGANLSSASLIGTSLANANISNATVGSADFSSSQVLGMRAANLSGSPNFLPDKWTIKYGYMMGPGANLSGLTIGNSYRIFDLSGMDLHGSNFSSSTIYAVNLDNSNLSGANFSSTQWLWAGGCGSFNGSDFSNANLSHSSMNLYWWNGNRWLCNYGMKNVNFSGADLSGTTIESPNLTNSNFANSNLTGTTIWNANLTLANFSGANVQGLNVYGPSTVLDNVSAIGVSGSISNFAGWTEFNQNIIGAKANAQGADLQGTNLTGLNLSGANLSGANLTWASLTGTNLTGSTLTGAVVDNAYFSNATLSGVTSGQISGNAGELPSTWILGNGYLIGPGANLTNANLSNLSLANVSLTGAVLTGVSSGGITGTPTSLPASWKMMNGYLAGPTAVLTNANLTNANLNGVSLAGASLSGVKSGNNTGTASALPASWSVTVGYIVGPTADLTGANLSGANLGNVSLVSATLIGVRSGSITGTPTAIPSGWRFTGGFLAGPYANLSNSNLTSSNLSQMDLTGADFTSSTLMSVSFANSVLNQAKFLSSNLGSANLTGTKLDGANFSNANLANVQSGSITGSSITLPTNWSSFRGYLVGPGANLSRADLSYSDLNGLVLTDANLGSANLIGVASGSLVGAPKYLPSGWSFWNGYLVGPFANLRGIDLSSVNGYDLGLNLNHADLTGANLQGTNLARVNIDGANLSQTKLSGVIGGYNGWADSIPSGWVQIGSQFGVSGSYLVGTGANLSHANLGGLVLRNIDFHDVNLSYASFANSTLSNSSLDNADLSGAGFYGLNSSGLTGVPSNLGADYRIIAGTIVGPRVNITGDQLKNADLSGVSLQDANLRGDLSGVTTDGSLGTPWILPNGWVAINGYLIGPGAKIDHANLSGATLANLNIAGAVLEHANLAGAQIYNTDLTGVQLGHANLSSISSGGLSGNPASLPDGWQITAQLLVGPSANLSNRILENVNLSGRNLTGTNLSGASLIGADLSGCDLTNANLLGAILRGTNLLGATVLDTTFTSGDLESLGFVASNGTLLHRMTGATTPTVSGVTRVGMVLNAATGTWASGIDLQLQWLRDGFPIVGQTSSTYILVPGDATHAVSVSVTATSPGFAPLVVRSDAFQIGLGSITSPTGWAILGNTAVGSTLNAPLTGWTEGVTIQYQWIKDNVDIAGATDSTYQLQPGDAGHYIKLRANASKLGYVSSGSTSVALRVALQQMSPARVSISGTVKVGKSIKAVSASWVAGSKTIFQWLIDGKAIKGATKQSFTVLPAQKGHKLSVKVTQSLEGYTSASQTSSAIKVG